MRRCSEPVLQNPPPYVLRWLLCPMGRPRFPLPKCCAGWPFSLRSLHQGPKTPMPVAFTAIARLIRKLGTRISRVEFIVRSYRANSLVPQGETLLYFSTQILGCRKSILQLTDNRFFSALSNPVLTTGILE